MYAHATAPIQEQRPVRQPKEEASMNTIVTAAAVNPSTPNHNKQEKQTAKEVIAANVQALIEQLEQGH